MEFNDGEQPMFSLPREQAGSMTQPEIIEHLVTEAAAEGYIPMDYNYAGIPNVYLRGVYSIDPEDPIIDIAKGGKHIADIFVIFVKEKNG